MTERDLVAALHASPEADEPRQAYAQWLETHGNPARAELLRIDTERRSLPSWHEHRIALDRRERAIWGDPQTKLRLWASLPNLDGIHLVWHRGAFPNLAQPERFEDLVAARDALASMAPERVSVPWPRRSRTVGFPPIPGVRGLELIREPWRWHYPSALANCDFLDDLQELSLQGHTNRIRGLRSVFENRPLTALRSLGLVGAQPRMVRAICDAYRGPSLHQLNLGTDRRAPTADLAFSLEALEGWPALDGLHRLDLVLDDFGPAVRTLLDSPRLSGLQELTLGRGTVASWPLGEASRIPALDAVGLRVESGSDAAMAFHRAPQLAKLKRLDVHGTAKDLSAVFTSPCMATLQALVVTTPSSVTDLLRELGRGQQPRLHTLEVSGRPSVEPVPPVLQRLSTPRLQAVRLHGPGPTTFDAHALAKVHAHLPELVDLRLT